MPLIRFRQGLKGARRAGDRARDAKDWEEAARHYRQVLDRAPRNAAIWVQFGHALKESGNRDEAETAYRKALEIEPNNPDTHLQLGHLLRIEGETDRAAAAYLRSLVLAPALPDALNELHKLGCTAETIGEAFWGVAPFADGARGADRPATAGLVFELTDLIEFIGDSRAPTGVQRVQLRVIASLLRRAGHGFEIDLVACSAHPDWWVQIPRDLFIRLADMLVAGGTPGDDAWRAIVITLETLTRTGKPYSFRRGATLFALGPTWSIPDYFLRLRAAKSAFTIRYVQVFYDAIPYMTPDLVPQGQTVQFNAWAASLLVHADRLLAISESSATDLVEIAHRLNRPITRPRVVRLDARFALAAPPEPDGRPGDVVRRHDLDRQPFVLFVATIEARKNHLMTFEVWLTMIRQRGLERTPMLICVGKPGWMAEGALAFLDASELLKKRVAIVSHLGDAELAELYRRCLFTVFPSLYEGWGLPITEAFCHGKVPLLAATPSLSEAGGEFAEYFDPLSQREMLARLERLIDDAAYRETREAAIREGFHARGWDEIADDFITDLPASPEAAVAAAEDAVWAPRAEPGHYYAMARIDATELWPGIVNGEMFRAGSGWRGLDPWGAWMKREAADIVFSVPTGDAPLAVYVGLCGLPGSADVPDHPESEYEVRVLGTAIRESGRLSRDEHRWLLLSLAAGDVRGGLVHLRLASNGSARCVEGGNARLVTMGVLGFYFCRADDTAARFRFFEALQLNRLHAFNGSPPASRGEEGRTGAAAPAEAPPLPADAEAG